MSGTVTVSWRESGLEISVPPQNYVGTQEHRAFRDLYEPPTIEVLEALEDIQDLEATRQLFEAQGIGAFARYRER